jgi:signal transduction histidine kinase
MNVCRNAIQAIAGKGTITIKSAIEGDDNVIDIIDSGPGISSKVKENIFQPFKSGSQEGTGLGLAISREIVKAHGGTLDLYDTSAKGSTFRIILPL